MFLSPYMYVVMSHWPDSVARRVSANGYVEGHPNLASVVLFAIRPKLNTMLNNPGSRLPRGLNLSSNMHGDTFSVIQFMMNWCEVVCSSGIDSRLTTEYSYQHTMKGDLYPRNHQLDLVLEPRDPPTGSTGTKSWPFYDRTPWRWPLYDRTPWRWPFYDRTPWRWPFYDRTPWRWPFYDRTPWRWPFVNRTPWRWPFYDRTPWRWPFYDRTPWRWPFMEMAFLWEDSMEMTFRGQDSMEMTFRGQDSMEMTFRGQDFMEMTFRGQDFMEMTFRGQDSMEMTFC